ncbi:MAG TPA: flagellar protein FlgN [Burkholderiaceae bacterium]|nr:flagellar protein FlgN [Burkholderiaceae bacterium]
MNASLTALQACLEKEANLMGEFLQILQEEAKVLEEGATEQALADTTERKNATADRLMEVAEVRNSMLQSMGFGSDGAGLSEAARQHPSLEQVRQALVDVTNQARSLNEANGRIIEVFLEHNQRALDTLRRLAGVGDIYDASGRKRPGNPGASRNIKAG